MARFDLIDEPWLPCVAADGNRVELGLRAALDGAHELREVSDPSPLVTVSLHRLLLAVLHRVHDGPKSLTEWIAIWSAGRFEAARIAAYLERWRGRFDLFDAERPFFQMPAADAGASPGVVADLAHEWASGNNATLFDHTSKAAPAEMEPAAAARYLVARQTFSYGGGVSKPFNFSDSPAARGISVLALGPNLFATLALNLQPYDRERPVPWVGDDLPVWEQETERTPDQKGTPPRGYLDRLTWASRKIQLLPDGEPPRVRQVRMTQHLREPDGSRDPLKCYRMGDKGPTPLFFRADRALWRDAHLLFARYDLDGKRERSARLFDWLADLELARRRGRVAVASTYRLAAFGATPPPGKPNIELWRAETLPLPLTYVEDAALAAILPVVMEHAGEVRGDLSQAATVLARLLEAPDSDQPGARQPDAGAVGRTARSLEVEPRFWSRLERPFLELLERLPADRRPDPEGDDGDWIYGEVAAPAWSRAVEGAARTSFTEVARGLGTSARMLKAVAKADASFNRGLPGTLAGFRRRFEDGGRG